MNSSTHVFAVLLIGLSLLLSACEQDKPSQQGESRAIEEEGSAKNTLDQGVEGQAETTSETTVDGAEVDSNPVLEEDESEETSSDIGGARGTAAEQKAALVEDMGFSTETATDLGLVEEEVTKPYCLGDGGKENKITATQACERISNRLASVSSKSCNAANLQASSCESVDGFPIFLREFAPLKDREPQGRILVIGGIHGDELTSVSIVFKWIAKLNKFHSGLFHWHVVPMMNPDGVLQRGAQRTNKNGVDLNRNLPSEDWEENALQYWRDKQGENPRRYPGEKPASEPETQWLIDEINDFKPDAIISVHAPYGVVDFDALLLNTAPKSLGKLHLNLLGTYPGSLGNYAGINRDIPVITLELPHAWDMPSEQETTKIWEDIVSWLRKNINTELADNDQ